MSVIDLERLLKDISPEAPSGEKDLEYDPAFIELQGKINRIHKPDKNKPAGKSKKPRWPEIQEGALELLTQTHDIRVAMFLTRALLHTSGLVGFKDGLCLIHRMTGQYWDTLYPRYEDKTDPFERTNILEELCDWNRICGPLLKTTLCHSNALGQFSLRDIRIAKGNTTGLVLGAEEKKSPPKLSTIEAAFKDGKIEDLEAIRDAIGASLQSIKELAAVLQKETGSDSTADFGKLNQLLKEMDLFFEKQMGNRPPPDPLPLEENSEAEKTETEISTLPQQTVSTPPEKSPQVITNRQDVIRILGDICAYYDQNEPGSPVPLLLKRARHLVDKSFFEIVEDLAPDSVAQIKQIITGSNDGGS